MRHMGAMQLGIMQCMAFYAMHVDTFKRLAMVQCIFGQRLGWFPYLILTTARLGGTQGRRRKMARWTTVSCGVRENPGCYDTGNGALAYITESADYPGVERVKIVPYAKGRGPGHTYYRLAEDASGAFVRAGGKGYATAREAVEARRYREG